MAPENPIKNQRRKDPYMDRRSGSDRREAYSITYFSNGGPERRQTQDRRTPGERRQDCISVTKWSSVCVEDSAAAGYE
jgi:hypothetical protein